MRQLGFLLCLYMLFSRVCAFDTLIDYLLLTYRIVCMFSMVHAEPSSRRVVIRTLARGVMFVCQS